MLFHGCIRLWLPKICLEFDNVLPEYSFGDHGSIFFGAGVLIGAVPAVCGHGAYYYTVHLIITWGNAEAVEDFDRVRTQL